MLYLAKRVWTDEENEMLLSRMTSVSLYAVSRVPYCLSTCFQMLASHFASLWGMAYCGQDRFQ